MSRKQYKKPKEEDRIADDEGEAESLRQQYGLPPTKLGACSVVGRPCSVPDGFDKMKKIGTHAPPVASYSEGGKVCCSKELIRMKEAIKEYTVAKKEDNMRCVNEFFSDIEKCCDKDQGKVRVFKGGTCCGKNKLANLEKEDKKK